MINPENYLKSLNNFGVSFFTGVPDSLLKEFCACVTDSYNEGNHLITANEGSAIGLGIGYYLGSEKIPMIYLQNSGLGNIINPITSLCIPHNVKPLLVIGHRHTLPQHKVMGEIDEKMLVLMDYSPYIIVKGSNNAK